MPLRIELAQASDVDDLVRLNGIAQNLHAQLCPDIFRSDWDPSELQNAWLERIGKQDSQVAVAKIDSELVGCIWFETQDRPQTELVHARRRIYVHHIVVDETARGAGIGAALLQYAEAEAERLGIETVVLDAWASNSTAQAFFSSQGYEPLNIVRRKIVKRR